MKLSKILIFSLLSTTIIFAQQNSDSLLSLNKKFQSFEYEKVISEADSLLNLQDSLSRDVIIELYRMKGISHFSLLQDRQAEDSFAEILKLDTTYTLDSAKTSPKIIAFFNEVKKEYKQQLEEIKKLETRIDTVYINNIEEKIRIEEQARKAALRSIILPGWGHLYSGQSAKGVILTSLSAVSFLSSVYFIFDTNSKEDEYVNAQIPGVISEKWEDYNSSYRMRNYSLITFAAVWVYAQLDLLFFSEGEEIKLPETDLSFNTFSGINLTYRITF